MHEVFRTYPPRLSETLSLARICFSVPVVYPQYRSVHQSWPHATRNHLKWCDQRPNDCEESLLAGRNCEEGVTTIEKKRRKEGATSPLRSQPRHIAVLSEILLLFTSLGGGRFQRPRRTLLSRRFVTRVSVACKSGALESW